MKRFKNILYVADPVVEQGEAFERAVALSEKNGQSAMTGLFRQSVFGRFGGYADVNDADRPGRGSVMC